MKQTSRYFYKNSKDLVIENKAFPTTAPNGTVPELIGEYGINYLDEATGGIFNRDFILIGSPTGIGKTQLCMNMAVKNGMLGRKVWFAALEAYHGEIEDRYLYQLYCKFYYDDPSRQSTEYDLSLGNFLKGRLKDVFEKYRISVQDSVEFHLNNVTVVYKNRFFTVQDLMNLKDEAIDSGANFLIIDHAHYFDYDMEKESSALTHIVKACNEIAQVHNLPIVLMAQLRKKDMRNTGPLRDEGDFHGTSNLVRLPSVCVLLSSGEYNMESKISETYVNITKSRFSPEARQFVARCCFDFKKQDYRPNYVLGNASGSEFAEINGHFLPKWARSAIRQKTIQHSLPYKD